MELEGGDNMFSIGDSEALLGEIEEFLTGERHEREPDRMLATVMFTDIVRLDRARRASWATAAGATCSSATTRSSGRRSSATAAARSSAPGDGFLATFDGPGARDPLRRSIDRRGGTLGLEVRAGLHTGELEVMDGDLGGLAVHIAARVMGWAAPSEVLVSSTVKDLVVGSGIDFEERGEHELRGVPGEWRLFSVVS